ncbi:metal-dependent hydrolase [Undibacterium sp.]|uniref:metal-dependent hydrolase n=1 Tax=Undibacterium sp. TaxID=1914977 RepID=UPI003753A3C2
MDNLTHSLVGALVGQMGLKRKTGLAMPTLVIAANLPDIDAVATLLGGHQHLALRRGLTHGPIAMLLLPLLLCACMLWFDAWQTRRGKRPDSRLPIDKTWLLGLAYIGCLSHPLLDWLNSYGVRFLEPFSSLWFYGDSIFIIDVWIWGAVILGVYFSYRRERRNAMNWSMPAIVSAALIGTYILVNGYISTRAEQLTVLAVESRFGLTPSLVVANPVPVQFWKREMLWRDDTNFGKAIYSVPNEVKVDENKGFHKMKKVDVSALTHNDLNARAFLFWSRMPVLSGTQEQVEINDQRFLNALMKDNFTVRVPN